ncbi:hypothetical protein AX14_009787 [Amanita brunnescens Koide BX004]|nr:hypothetical protein AX14_009787 [Amanita brunnescens Koide BX004]
MVSFAAPFRTTYRYLQRHAHENPVIFYSVVIGTIGPVMLVTVPPLRERWGYKPAQMVPTTYPLPKGPRTHVQGYDDE